MAIPVPMSSPGLTDAEIAAVNQALTTRYLSIGPQIEEFERGLASYVGATYAIGVNSGTSGLYPCINCARSEPRYWITSVC